MDNFMEHPTYKMNRGAILTQGWRRLVLCLEWGRRRILAAYLRGSSCSRRRIASGSATVAVSISQSACNGAS
ncbi:hypothetical protein FCI59_21575 [Pseudomonas protegens]|uniref:Uncharacterized protein n=1 Tax=Pseudomonas protegens TaxID=380021 RepID=A0ABY2V947_9PSED|nr:hypothetical protein [Pseudomonas sp. JV245A]NTZ73894.1 hypothetical protein [Pseudomonas protegens]TMM60357.1 hypothetical protein FEF10_28330 [Pseudomonas protegens]